MLWHHDQGENMGVRVSVIEAQQGMPSATPVRPEGYVGVAACCGITAAFIRTCSVKIGA